MGLAFRPDQTDSKTRIASQAAQYSPRAVLFHCKTQNSFISVHESIPVWQFLRPCIPETNTMLYINCIWILKRLCLNNRLLLKQRKKWNSSSTHVVLITWKHAQGPEDPETTKQINRTGPSGWQSHASCGRWEIRRPGTRAAPCLLKGNFTFAFEFV